jgi:hypothetical protein
MRTDFLPSSKPDDQGPPPTRRFLSLVPVFTAWLAMLVVLPSARPGLDARSLPAAPDILTKAKAYCRLLQTAALDFVCMEKITERVRGVSANKGSPDVDPLLFEIKDVLYEHELLYEYQFVRSGPLVRETRKLLEEDGRAKNEKDCVLLTRFFHFQNVLFGPAALLDERNSDNYDFEVRGEEPEGAERAVILTATPKRSAEAGRPPFGMLWVSPGDGSILKIEWDGRTIASYSALEERAKALKARPSLTLRTEFGFPKGGLRFPSRHTIVEAYLKGKSPPAVRSEMVVEYSHYQFFTVETSIDLKKRS